MIYRIIVATFFAVLFTGVVNAQSQQIIPIYNSKDLLDNTLIIKSDSGQLNITGYTSGVVNLTFFDKGDEPQSNTLAPRPAPINIRVTQNLDDIFFATDSLWVIVNKYDLSVKFLKKHGETLLLKCDTYFLNNHPKLISFALQSYEDLSVVDLSKWHMYGELAGKTKEFHGKKKICKPVIVSEKGYALYFKNSSDKKVQIVHRDHYLSINERFSTKSFFFLSGRLSEIGRDLKRLND